MEEKFETPDPHGPVLVSIWVDAVIIWMFKGFRGKLNAQLYSKNQRRNMWIGYIAQLIIVSLLVYFAYKK